VSKVASRSVAAGITVMVPNSLGPGELLEKYGTPEQKEKYLHRLAKGCYCAVSGRSPFQRLIYPVPVPGALGIHATLDMQGQVRLGPDITWVDAPDYTVPEDAPAKFRAACLPYWPDLAARDIAPAYAGLRPKIHGPGDGFADFRIDGPDHHGLPGLVNLFGIESPGLTSSLAIAEHVAALLHQ
jgi:L-2-hydroxyglutarate oxidase LhgO